MLYSDSVGLGLAADKPGPPTGLPRFLCIGARSEALLDDQGQATGRPQVELIEAADKLVRPALSPDGVTDPPRVIRAEGVPLVVGLSNALAGYLFVEQAIALIQRRFKCHEETAMAKFLEAAVAGRFKTWQRNHINPPQELPASVWISASIRSTGERLIYLAGARYHRHRFLVTEGSFRDWVDEVGRSSKDVVGELRELPAFDYEQARKLVARVT